ncbi:DUF1853 family protein [Lutibacter sp. A80]|uniref:DUF1853 family protein n=1 Tax=Lutibacter sp. A80 TaxID=2918453 RepID=UPI001F068C15|nr:DUF1853 family protein [Lutibacter sp. A80]UMB60483.1 DUF1853 family protein [Lutibacter sp. A80]
MNLNTKEIQLQYEGFLNTALLWENNDVLNLKQFILETKNTTQFNGAIVKNQRLGKRVERFLSHQLQQDNSIEILVENIQIQNNKITLGELDCILMQNNKPIHLEVIYKFYLYDATVGKTALEHWIGPNRKDSLIEKLNKLKNKQLPLLYNPFTKPLLKKLNLETTSIQQQVLFKAQLFIPYQIKNIDFNALNQDCVKGFYIHFNELQQFNTCKFYIPTKINWLQEIETQSKWLNFETFSQKLEVFIHQKIAPLCWLKNSNGETEKFFVVWW